MATAFATVTDWQLGYLDPGREDGGSIPSGSTEEATSGYKWVRDQYTIILYRIGQTLTSYAPKIGESVAGSAIDWVGGATTVTANASYTYYCIDNPLTQEVQGADIWRETIVWQWVSKWYQVAASLIDTESPGLEPDE